MQLFNKIYILFFSVLLISWMLNGCQRTDEQALTTAEQAVKLADTAFIKLEAATDVATTIKAAEITVTALNKLTDAIIVSHDMSITTDAREKFELVKFKTVQRLHTFIEPGSSDCQNILDILLQLDSSVKDFACQQRDEDDLFKCHLDDETQQCKCTRTSAGTCPNNQDCILLADSTCQCDKKCA
ncbi:MAG: hypothetical protein DRQ49_08450 [Gammaproteobacteria bacterium]|nr:MAG: hypothetical protein DRQ49_08450 [Gammaproteobacteria bacterium]